MLSIKHDKSYLRNDILKELGYRNETINKICFQGNFKIPGSEQIIQQIKDYLENTYKMYQYKKDNGVKYGEHELFYWCIHNDKIYFDVTLNDKFTIEYNNKIVAEIEEYINNNYAEATLYVRYQYSDIINWDKVNDYLNVYELDFNNIPFNLLSSLAYYSFCAGNGITGKNKEKLYNIELEIQKYFKGKKVIFNNIKGTVKEFKEGYFGVFKPRATRTYYPFQLSTIHSL